MDNTNILIILLTILNVIYLGLIFVVTEAWVNGHNKLVNVYQVLNKIAMVGSGSKAYTSEFTEIVNSEIRKVLDNR